AAVPGRDGRAAPRARRDAAVRLRHRADALPPALAGCAPPPGGGGGTRLCGARGVLAVVRPRDRVGERDRGHQRTAAVRRNASRGRRARRGLIGGRTSAVHSRSIFTSAAVGTKMSAITRPSAGESAATTAP